MMSPARDEENSLSTESIQHSTIQDFEDVRWHDVALTGVTTSSTMTENSRKYTDRTTLTDTSDNF